MAQLLDFIPLVLFFVAFKMYDIYIATAVVIVATLLQALITKILGKKVPTMQWITLGLIVVMGGATLYLQDEQFIKWKLTIIEWLFAGAFLGSQFIGDKPLVQRMLGSAIELPKRVWQQLNLLWALFFAAVGAGNIYVMHHYSTDQWVMFKTFGVPALMLVFVLLQMIFIYKHLPKSQD